jgi:hypothetical protein
MSRRILSQLGGWLLIVGSGIHAVLGLFIYSDALRAIASDGWINAVHPFRDREAAWWFFIVGLFYLTAGMVVVWLQRRGLPVPAFLGWELIGLAVVGSLLAFSPGWPVIAFAGGLVVLASRTPASAAAQGTPWAHLISGDGRSR